MSEDELANFRLWQMIGAGVLVWIVSFAVRKFPRINLDLSYLVSIIVCAVVAAILSPLPLESAIACGFMGAVGWNIERWISKRKSPQQPTETQSQNGFAKNVLLVLTAIAVFAWVRSTVQEFNKSRAVRKSENIWEELQADATKKHPDMPRSEAMLQESNDRTTEALTSETDELKRKKMAADMFFGFFFVNARARPEFCSEQGINIQPFVHAFEQAHANEIDKARSIKARASVDEKKLYTLIQPQLRKAIVQNMNDIAKSEKISIKEVCQRFSENADAIVKEMQLAKVDPVLFKALTSAK